MTDDHEATFQNFNFGHQDVGQQYNVHHHHEPQPAVTYEVLQQGVPIGTEDRPRYVTSFGVVIQSAHAVQRIRLKAIHPGPCQPPVVRNPQGHRGSLGGSSTTCADGSLPGLWIEFDRPPGALIFDVFTNNTDEVGFDAEIVG